MKLSLKTVLLASSLCLASGVYQTASAGPEPFLGQIVCYSFNFAPRGWLPTDGRLINISSNSALFALLGTQFGGDGRNTFALPNLQGRAMVGTGSGPGLPFVQIGQNINSTNTIQTFKPQLVPTDPNNTPVETLNVSTTSVPVLQNPKTLTLNCAIATQGIFPTRQ